MRADLVLMSAAVGIGTTALADLGDWGFGPMVFPGLSIPTKGGFEKFEPADLNGDGLMDLVMIQPGWPVQVMFRRSDGTWAKNDSIPGSLGGADLRLCDLNADGHSDVVAYRSAFGKGTIEVILGRGDGSFEEPARFSVGSTPRDISVGDVDGDGFDDVAVAEYKIESSQVRLLFSDGYGGFRDPVLLASTGNARAVYIGDLLGRGVVDVVCAASSGQIEVWRGTGGGLLGPRETFFTGLSAWKMIGSDLDRDGDTELVVSTSSSGRLGILASDSTGAVSLIAEYAIGWADEILLADLNGDGFDDLVQVGDANTSIGVRWNDGDGLMHRVDRLACAISPTDAYVDDYNKDGRADIIIGRGGMSPILGLGNEQFFIRIDYLRDDFDPYVLAAADFDADGLMDLVVPPDRGSGLVLKRGRPEGGFGKAEPLNVSVGTSYLISMDFDEDEVCDLFVSNGLGFTVLTKGLTVQLPSIKLDDQPCFDVMSPAVDDFNGDGRPDVAMSSGCTDQVHVWLNLPSEFVRVDPIVLPYRPSYLCAGDLNSDELDDLIVHKAGAHNARLDTYLNAGFGTFVPGNSRSMPETTIVDSVVDDFDRDGRADLAVCSLSGPTVRVYFGEGNGGFGLHEASRYTAAQDHLVSGDFNRDGYPDLAVADRFSSSVQVLFNQQDGSPGSPVNHPVSSATDSLVAADADADGHADLITANYNSAMITILPNRLMNECTTDWNGDGGVNIFDVASFAEDVVDRRGSADLDGNGSVNFFDLVVFLDWFQAGC